MTNNMVEAYTLFHIIKLVTNSCVSKTMIGNSSILIKHMLMDILLFKFHVTSILQRIRYICGNLKQQNATVLFMSATSWSIHK